MSAASAEAFPWIDVVVNGKPMRRCTGHKRDFKRTAICTECTKARRSMPKQAKIELPDPPKGCRSSTDIERWFVAVAEASLASANRIEAKLDKPTKPAPAPAPIPKKKARGKAAANEPALIVVAAIVEGLDFHDEAAIANHRDRAIKSMRAATELATRREDDWIVDQRDERMAGRERGASH